MYIEPNRLNQLNKNLFGHGILQTKKLKPDLGRIVMPDPSLPKIKRYNIKSNNPLNYLLSANANVQPQSQIQPQPQQLIPIQNSEEIQDIQQPQENINQQEELYSQKIRKNKIKKLMKNLFLNHNLNQKLWLQLIRNML